MDFPEIITLTGANRAQRMLEAGNLKVTVKSKKTGEHITVQFASRKRNPSERGKRWLAVHPKDADSIFMEVPKAGGGFGDKIGTLRMGRPHYNRISYTPPKGHNEHGGEHRYGSKPDPARIWAAQAALRWVMGEAEEEHATYQESNECGRCRRELTDPVSIERGIGPECWGKITGSKHQERARV